MLITEWQARFIQSVQGQYNIYPPAMINALMGVETDAAVFKAKAKEFFAPYEAATISSTPGSRVLDPLSPRALWFAIETIVDGTPGPGPITTEDGKPILTEGGLKPIVTEDTPPPSTTAE